MRVTTRTNLAVRILMHCAVNIDRLVTREEIADTVNASAHHTGHVVGRLSHLGLLHTVRGRSGGLTLAQPAGHINIGSVFRDLEGETPIAECFAQETNTCPLKDVCLLREALAKAAEAFFAELDRITLRDIVENNLPLIEMMSHHQAPACQGAAG